MSTGPRRRSADVLAALAAVALLLSLALGYVQRAVGDDEQFANRATATLRDDAVRAIVAEQLTDQLVLRQQADLIAARPLIESAMGGVVGSRAFTSLFRAAVRDLHRSLVEGDADTVTLTVADVGTVAAAALERVRPALARDLEARGRIEVVRRDLGSVATALGDVSDDAWALALALLVAALILATAALLVAPDRRRTVVALGIATAVAGVVLVVALSVGRSIAVDAVGGPEPRAVVGAIWDAFLSDLRSASWILAGSGAIVAATASSLIRPAPLGAPLRRLAAAAAREPRTAGGRAARGAALVAAGVALLVARDAVLSLLVTLAAVYLIYEGASILLRLVHRPETSIGAATAEAAPDAQEAGRDRSSHRRARRLLAPALAAAAIALATGAFAASGGTGTPPPGSGPCNGHEQLCDRPLNEVALPATHNSMSVPLPGWYSAEQDRPIPEQLRDGVRGLLIDTHYADRLPNGRIRTVIDDAAARETAGRDGIGPEAVDAALRIRARLGFKGRGERGIYLCHTFCELGATKLDEVLGQLRRFLVANPGEVVVVVNQDAITPADFVAAVRRAGLERHVYRGPVDGRWPTLRQMIASDQRLVLLAEEHAGGAPWYRPAYARALQETPYAFGRVGQLTDPARRPASCVPNRGPSSAPLLLLNHWISTDPLPQPTQAATVNAYGPLLARARACAAIRHRTPNLVAVNFYRRGDLMRVVDALNGIDGGSR